MKKQKEDFVSFSISMPVSTKEQAQELSKIIYGEVQISFLVRKLIRDSYVVMCSRKK